MQYHPYCFLYRLYSSRLYPGEPFRNIALRLEQDGVDLMSKLLEVSRIDT